MVNFEGYTDSNGKFTVQVPAGEYNYLISKEGYADKNGMITVNGETNVDVTLEGTGNGTLTVHTYDRKDQDYESKPSTHAPIRIKYGNVELRESTDDKGEYVLENIPLGTKVTCMLMEGALSDNAVDMEIVEITGDTHANLYHVGHNTVYNIHTLVKNKQNGDAVSGVFCRTTCTAQGGTGAYDVDETYTIDSTGKMIYAFSDSLIQIYPIDVKFKVFDSADYGPAEIKHTINVREVDTHIELVAEVMPKNPLMEVTVLKEKDLTPIPDFPVMIDSLSATHNTDSEGKAYFTVPFDDTEYEILGQKEIDDMPYNILDVFKPTRENHSITLIAKAQDGRTKFEEVFKYIDADTGKPITGLEIQGTVIIAGDELTNMLYTDSRGIVIVGNLPSESQVNMKSLAQPIIQGDVIKKYDASEINITVPTGRINVVEVKPKLYNVTVTCDGYTSESESNRLEGATVYCRNRYADGDYDLYTGVTDGEGNYEFVNLPAPHNGDWEFQASHPDYVDSAIVTVPTDTNRILLILYHKNIGCTTVYGRVLGETEDRDYKPVELGDITVTGTLITGETITERGMIENGYFNMRKRFAFNQDVSVTVNAEGYTQYNGTIHIDENFSGETILLNRTHRQVVFNTLFADQYVATNVPIKVTNVETGKVYNGNTNDNGVWTIPLLSKGSVESAGYVYDVEYSYPEYPEQQVKRIWVYGNENDEPLRFPLYIYGPDDVVNLAVAVVDRDTKTPIKNARVRSRLLDSKIYTDSYTNDDGVAVTKLPKNSNVRVSVSASGYTSLYDDIIIGDGDKAVEFMLNAVKMNLTFTVKDKDGNPVSDAHVTGGTPTK